MAEEAVNPAVDLPIGILGSLAAATGIYIAMSCVLTGEIPHIFTASPFYSSALPQTFLTISPQMIFGREYYFIKT